ncbi:34104_t:CDS:2 [Gigaspora margarita]|uniref:34104_t:CDS:1 n=1 Tax=Gigaspora margarita TaxID=4874 RepID=A0ABN7V6L0_GIGMA|nr:34104_t:CDS:2 [Gigaspora margarita]
MEALVAVTPPTASKKTFSSSEDLFVIRDEGIEDNEGSKHESVVVRDEGSVGDRKNEKGKPKSRDEDEKGVVTEDEVSFIKRKLQNSTLKLHLIPEI